MSTENKNPENEHLNPQEAISKGEKFVEKNINTILYVLLGIVVVVVGLWAYNQYVRKPKAEKASAALFASEDRFINDEEGREIVNGGLKDVMSKYKGENSINVGHAYMGICYYDMGEYAQALEELKKFEADENMVAPSITRLMGDCYVQLDKLEEAAKAFEEAAENASNDVVSPSCLLKAGRVYEELKQYDKALKAYQAIKDLYYTAPESSAVEADIIRVKTLLPAK